jgi:hypothetical protein
MAADPSRNAERGEVDIGQPQQQAWLSASREGHERGGVYDTDPGPTALEEFKRMERFNPDKMNCCFRWEKNAAGSSLNRLYHRKRKGIVS